MKQIRNLLLSLFIPLSLFAYPLVPNVATTPGDECTDTNPDFGEYRYAEQISYCNRNVSTSLKKAIYAQYGIAASDQKNYTIDHLIPLSLGGSNSRKNLWPENKKVKALRPQLEIELYVALRDGETTQEAAVEKILRAKADPCHFEEVPEGVEACNF